MNFIRRQPYYTALFFALASPTIFAWQPQLLTHNENRRQTEQPSKTDEDSQDVKANTGMTLEKFKAVIAKVGSDVMTSKNGTITFTFDQAQLIAVVATQANRMRLLSPIMAARDLNDTQLAATLVSNYHLALDARYAVGEGVLYSAYIHPLKELSEQQLLSAIRQVATLRNTFGTTYTSGELSFGVQQESRMDI